MTMRSIRSIALACLAAAAMVGQGFAQDSGQEGEEDQNLVAELVVKPSEPGPAWWRVSDADSRVYILIFPDTSIRDMPWDKTVLERRMAGANQLLTPMGFNLLDPRSLPGITAAVVQSPKLIFAGKPPKPPKADKNAPPPPTLEEQLPPDIRARFVAMREAIGQPAERYAEMSFPEAARRIAADYRAKQGLVGGEVMRTANASAQRNKVPKEPAYDFIVPVANFKVESHGAIGGPECIEWAMTQAAERVKLDREVYQAWMEGDVRGLLKRPRRAQGPRCEGAGMSAGNNDPKLTAKMNEDFRDQQVKSLEKALRKPGRTVALLSVTSPFGGNGGASLLGVDGVLERLKAKGYQVDTPAVLGD
ncbi:TraB/GumN family protein [soil metagenome]